MSAESTDGGAYVSFPDLPSEVPNGWTGPIRVQGMTTDRSHMLRVYVRNDTGEYDWGTDVRVGNDGVVDFSVSPRAMGRADEYSIEVYSELHGFLGRGTFVVVAAPVPAPEFSRAELSRTVFFPRVRDRFKDDVTVRYATSRPSIIGVKVINSSGRTVRSEKPRSFRPSYRGPRTWTWNGKSNRGKMLPVGRYRIKLTAESAGQEVSRTLKVELKSDIVSRRFSESWRGNQYDRLHSTGSCWADSYLSRATLNCWDFFNSTRDYAEAQYWFNIPRNARNIKWGMNGDYGCCNEPGRVIRKGERVSPTRYVVKVTVDGYRAYDVFKAWASWTAKVRR